MKRPIKIHLYFLSINYTHNKPTQGQKHKVCEFTAILQDTEK